MSKVELIFARNLELYLIQHPDCILIDVRSKTDYERYHIKNAVNMPYGEEREWDLDKRKRIVVYCERGVASIHVARDLMEKGYRAISVVGGMHDYLALKK